MSGDLYNLRQLIELTLHDNERHGVESPAPDTVVYPNDVFTLLLNLQDSIAGRNTPQRK